MEELAGQFGELYEYIGDENDKAKDYLTGIMTTTFKKIAGIIKVNTEPVYGFETDPDEEDEFDEDDDNEEGEGNGNSNGNDSDGGGGGGGGSDEESNNGGGGKKGGGGDESSDGNDSDKGNKDGEDNDGSAGDGSDGGNNDSEKNPGADSSPTKKEIEEKKWVEKRAMNKAITRMNCLTSRLAHRFPKKTSQTLSLNCLQ